MEDTGCALLAVITFLLMVATFLGLVIFAISQREWLLAGIVGALTVTLFTVMRLGTRP